MHRLTWTFHMNHSGRMHKRSRRTFDQFLEWERDLIKGNRKVKYDYHQSLS
jgi:hypothetical protein